MCRGYVYEHHVDLSVTITQEVDGTGWCMDDANVLLVDALDVVSG
jgi:hypothetical protein